MLLPLRTNGPLPSHWVVIGNPTSKRVALFQEALVAQGIPRATVLAYRDLLAGSGCLEQVVEPGSVVRLESPGQDFEVEKALLVAGADVPDEPGSARLSRGEAERLIFDKGRIFSPRQWYLGFCKTLRLIERQLTACPPHLLTSSPADIAVFFDKELCANRLANAGIATTPGLGRVRSYEELRERMRQTGHRRVFVKLAHGSSASGVVAYETSGPREQAFTSVELVQSGGEVRLYNSRRIRRYPQRQEIATILDLLCREGVRVEQWIPKAALEGHVFDLRRVVIAGRPRHTVMRLSRGPMTNLHLKNRRADAGAARELMGELSWHEALETCRRAAALFPGSLQVGIDLAVTPGGRRHALLEVNAFGDLLHGISHEGEGTHEAEVKEIVKGWRPS